MKQRVRISVGSRRKSTTSHISCLPPLLLVGKKEGLIKPNELITHQLKHHLCPKQARAAEHEVCGETLTATNCLGGENGEMKIQLRLVLCFKLVG